MSSVASDSCGLCRDWVTTISINMWIWMTRILCIQHCNLFHCVANPCVSYDECYWKPAVCAYCAMVQIAKHCGGFVVVFFFYRRIWIFEYSCLLLSIRIYVFYMFGFEANIDCSIEKGIDEGWQYCIVDGVELHCGKPHTRISYIPSIPYAWRRIWIEKPEQTEND